MWNLLPSRGIYMECQNLFTMKIKIQNENRLLQILRLCALNVIAVSTHHIFPKYSDILTPYHTWPKVRTKVDLLLNKWLTDLALNRRRFLQPLIYRSPLFAYPVQIFRLTIVFLDSEKNRIKFCKKKKKSFSVYSCESVYIHSLFHTLKCCIDYFISGVEFTDLKYVFTISLFHMVLLNLWHGRQKCFWTCAKCADSPQRANDVLGTSHPRCVPAGTSPSCSACCLG